MGERSRYQVFPDLQGGEWERLKSSIEKHGLQHDIIKDEDGNILDGHQRERACLELGIKPKYKVRKNLSEDEKWALVFDLNEHRRHLTPKERREVAVEMRRRGFQQARIAELLQVDQASVSRYLAAAKRDGIELPKAITTTRGTQYPTERKPPTRRNDAGKPSRTKAAGDEPRPTLPDFDAMLVETYEDAPRLITCTELMWIMRFLRFLCRCADQQSQEHASLDGEWDELMDRLMELVESGDLVNLRGDDFEDIGVRMIKMARYILWGDRERRRS